MLPSLSQVAIREDSSCWSEFSALARALKGKWQTMSSVNAVWKIMARQGWWPSRWCHWIKIKECFFLWWAVAYFGMLPLPVTTRIPKNMFRYFEQGEFLYFIFAILESWKIRGSHPNVYLFKVVPFLLSKDTIEIPTAARCRQHHPPWTSSLLAAVDRNLHHKGCVANTKPGSAKRKETYSIYLALRNTILGFHRFTI